MQYTETRGVVCRRKKKLHPNQLNASLFYWTAIRCFFADSLVFLSATLKRNVRFSTKLTQDTVRLTHKYRYVHAVALVKTHTTHINGCYRFHVLIGRQCTPIELKKKLFIERNCCFDFLFCFGAHQRWCRSASRHLG